VAAVEIRRSPEDLPSLWPVAYAARVSWTALGVEPGDLIYLRVVVRNPDGQVVQVIPGDGLDRVLDVPAGSLNGRRWRA
jgi:hypothetical protein